MHEARTMSAAAEEPPSVAVPLLAAIMRVDSFVRRFYIFTERYINVLYSGVARARYIPLYNIHNVYNVLLHYSMYVNVLHVTHVYSIYSYSTRIRLRLVYNVQYSVQYIIIIYSMHCIYTIQFCT